MSDEWNALAFQAAMSRLAYWQRELMEGERFNDPERVREAARFIEEYGRLVAEMTAKKPPESI